MICSMKTSIDSAGRLVLPKAIRDEANLQPGDPLEVTFRDGRIEIEPAPGEGRSSTRPQSSLWEKTRRGDSSTRRRAGASPEDGPTMP